MINVIKITDSFAQIEVKGVTITFTEPYLTVGDKYTECDSFIDRCIAHAITIYQSTRVNPISNPPLPRPAGDNTLQEYRKRGYITGEPRG